MKQAAASAQSSNLAASGWGSGLIGVIMFSGSLPATRLAVMAFEPLFLTVCRASIAGSLAVLLLMVFNEQRPSRAQFSSLCIVSLGVVLGFPLLTALALQHVTSAHSIVFIGLLPLSTALFAVLRGGERPQPMFWVFSGLGSAIVVGFALWQGLSASPLGDALMLLAVLVCGLGYAEGAKVSRALGGWQVICWALVICLPLMLPLALLTRPHTFSDINPTAWLSLAYVSVFGVLVGLVFWYRGLALGGTAAVGQLQLLQPFFGLALAASVLDEQVSAAMLGVTLAVIACVGMARKHAR